VPRRFSAKSPDAEPAPTEMPEAPAGFKLHHGLDFDAAAALAVLRRDPSLKFTATGRSLLAWLGFTRWLSRNRTSFFVCFPSTPRTTSRAWRGVRRRSGNSWPSDSNKVAA